MTKRLKYFLIATLVSVLLWACIIFWYCGSGAIVKNTLPPSPAEDPARVLQNIATRSTISFDRSRGVLINPVCKFAGDPYSAGDQATPESYGDEKGKKDVF